MKTLSKTFSFVIMLLFVSSCASLNPLSVLQPDPKLEVNANVGKNVEQEKNQVKVEAGNSETKQEAEKITNDNNYTADKIENITQNIPLEYMLILALFAGWAVPTPKECYFGVKAVVGDILTTFIVTPIKGVAKFILQLFGRNP